MDLCEIKNLVLDVPNFPKPGVLFKDITPILESSEAFRSLAMHFKTSIEKLSPTHLVAIESRGFIFGAAVAQYLNIGVILARKPGKLPRETEKFTYDLEYGTDTLEIHKGVLKDGDRVVIIDDVLATGGTAHAVESICNNMGAEVLGHHFLLEVELLKGREKLLAPAKAFIQV